MKVTLLGYRSDGSIESWRPDCLEGLQQLGCDVTPMTLHDATPDDVAATTPDLLLWLRDSHHDTVGMWDCLRRLRDAGTVTAALHMDLFWGVAHREPHIGKSPWWHCEYVFTADGGRHDWGEVNHHWFPPAFGTRYLGLHPDPGPGPSAVFVGSVSQRIHGRDRIALLDWARRTYPDFEHYGTRHRQVWGYELNKLYASAALVLGDSVDAPFYWSDRLPRSLGRGAVLAHPYVEGMDEQGFTDEVMIRYRRGDFEMIRHKRDSMTERDVKHMREAAVELVRERHTWRVALGRVLETVGLA